MRLDGLSSTALNRGLQLHESQAFLLLFSPSALLVPIYFFFQGGSNSVASQRNVFWGMRGENKAGDRDIRAASRYSCTSTLFPLHAINARGMGEMGRKVGGDTGGEIQLLCFLTLYL